MLFRSPLWKFLLADGLSAAVTVPLVVSLGYYFGDHLDDVRRRLHGFEWAAAAVILLGVGIWWLARRRLHARLRRPVVP